MLELIEHCEFIYIVALKILINFIIKLLFTQHKFISLQKSGNIES